MAVPAYATDLNDIFTDGGSWTVLSGRATDPDTDDYIQGASCWSHDPFSSGIEGGVVNSSETITAGDAVFIWTKADISPALATHAAGGVQALIGNASTALKAYYVAGSDDLVYGGWKCIPVDPTKTQSTSIGSPTTTTAYFGVRWNVPSTGPNKGYPFKIDAMRHGKNLEITAGDATTPATWDDTAVYDSNNARMWGICQPTDSGAAIQGHVYWGTAAASVYSRESNRTIVINDTEWTDTDFTQIIFAHASNDIVWENVGLLALGTSNKGIIDVTANGTIEWNNSTFQGIGTTSLLSNCTFGGSKWLGCDQVDSGGATITGGIIQDSVNASALLVDTAIEMADITGVSFVDNLGPAGTAGHSIELTATGSHTFTDISFSGGGGTPGSNLVASSGSATADVYNNSGGAITINVSGGDTPSVRNAAGSTTTVVSGQVTLLVIVKDSSGSLVTSEDVNVLVEAAAGGNMTEGDDIIKGFTDTNGEIEDTRSYTVDQPLKGWARKSSGTPFYKQATVVGTVDKNNGLTITLQMIGDE